MAANNESSGTLSPYTRRIWVAVLILATVVAVGVLLGWLLTGLLVLFAAVLFSVFLNQLSRWVAGKVGLPYHGALAVVVITLLAIVAGIGFLMGNQILSQASEFYDQLTTAGQETWTRLKQGQVGRWMSSDKMPPLKEMLPSRSAVISTAGTAAMGTLSAIGGIVLVVVMGFYLAMQPEKYREGILRLFPPAHRERTGEVLQKLIRSLWAWTLGRLVAMAVIGVASALGLWALGVPLPITNGVISGVLNFVPNLGPIMAAIPAMLLSLQQGTTMPLYVAGLYFGLQFLEANFLTPLIDQQQVSLPPALILGVQLLMGMAAGILGLMLATPLAAAVFIIVREVYVKDTLEAQTMGGHGTSGAE